MQCYYKPAYNLKKKTMTSPSCYIINNSVEFNVKERTLTSLEDNNNKIILYAPASGCLLLLLKNRNTVLGKDVFFDEVWKKNGVHVTANTFYQNISILRRSFIKLGQGNEIINTIPRKGMQLSKFLAITEITEETEKKNSISLKKEKSQNWKNNNKKIKLIGMMLFIIILAQQLISIGIQEDEDFFRNYHFVKKIEECLVYTKDDSGGIDDYDKYIKTNMISCEKYKFNYLTTYKFSRRTSVIRCDNPIKSKNTKCLSEYHIL
ncbi:transcriptional regulator [Erwinia sp. AnSW2-5]|uniref:winged helix-turn-helix domain-containing protein n=1 Tax=Erwinia sp. AnSW2-5 TaxID=3367692 RepID=UPI00385EC919